VEVNIQAVSPVSRPSADADIENRPRVINNNFLNIITSLN
jgi:hypothetical protein